MELEELNLRNPIHIGYYDPFDIYPLIEADFASKLPLTNLHWKFTNQKLQSIPLLPIKLVEEVPKTNVVADESIYSRVMFVKFDHLDTYRSQVRPLIIEWLKNLVLKYKSEWLIVLYVHLSIKDKPSTLVKTSHFDKLKLDFGPDGKELMKLNYSSDLYRCFKIRQADTKLEKLESYNDLIHGLKSILLASFTGKYQHYITHSTNSASEKFLTRLSLGDLFNDIRLFQDSLNVYDDLSQDLHTSLKSIAFSHDLTLPENYDNYKFESSIDINLIRKAFVNDQFSLFDIKCLLFISQSTVLQSLANFAKTISISAIYISSLYQKLIGFLNDLLINFPKYDLNEFIIVIIDNYLQLPICQKLFEINSESSDDSNYQLHEILEFRGELRLLQRSRYLEIARQFGYHIKGIEQEISLETDRPKSNYTYSKINNTMKSAEDFYAYFESVTELVIQDFAKCGRTKSIDILSIDLALLNYQKENYEESLLILQESYDFFIENGWNFMGSYLLEVYINCITQSRPEDYGLLTVTYLNLLASLCETKVMNSVGINNYGIVKQVSQLENIFQKVKDNSLQMSEALTYPLESFFNLKQNPFIYPDDKSYKYFIDVDLYRKSEVKLDFEAINLYLTDIETNENLVFSATRVVLSGDRIRLYSSDFKRGKFTAVKIELLVNENLSFVQELYIAVSANDTIIQADSLAATNMLTTGNEKYYLYQNPNSLWCKFVNSLDIELGSTKMQLYIHNGQLDVSNLNIKISGTEGIKFLESSEIEVDQITSGTSHMILIPYTYYSDNKLVKMKADISYTCDGEEYQHVMVNEVDTTLTVTVTVQDTFREDFIYSRFQIGTSIPKFPIRLISNSLTTENENYDIIQPKLIPGPLIAFAEQPASIFYKIVPHSKYSIKSSDCLDLDIQYVCIKDECELRFADYLKSKLGPELNMYYLVLKELIIQRAIYELNSFAVSSVIRISNSDEIINIIDEVLPRYVGVELSIQEMQKKLKEIVVEEIEVDVEKNRLDTPIKKLHIPVSMPTLQYLQMIEFDFEKASQYLVGEPIHSKIKVSTITKWFLDEVETTEQSFQLSIQNDDNWLLSGLKKNSFVVETNKTNTFEFDLVLIPLNVGNLSLPKVTVKPVGEVPKNSTSEVSIKNGLETILIVPELESITFTF